RDQRSHRHDRVARRSHRPARGETSTDRGDHSPRRGAGSKGIRDGPSARWERRRNAPFHRSARIAAELEKRTALPCVLIDERYTTAIALRAIHDMGGSTRDRKGDVDALAATVLLQHALQRPR